MFSDLCIRGNRAEAQLWVEPCEGRPDRGDWGGTTRSNWSNCEFALNRIIFLDILLGVRVKARVRTTRVIANYC